MKKIHMEQRTISFNEQFRNRTKHYAISICRAFSDLPKKEINWIISKQVIRSATSVAANFRAATRGRSHAEYYSKLCIVVEESDETLFWLEMSLETNVINQQTYEDIYSEGQELLQVFSKTKKRLKENPKK